MYVLNGAGGRYINGDLEIFSNTGTVLTGFHLTGVTVVSAAFGSTNDKQQEIHDHDHDRPQQRQQTGDRAAAPPPSPPPLFVGELMTFKCCDQDFSEYIWAPNGLTYAIGDYYQESGPQNVYASSEPCPLGPPPKDGGDGKPSQVVLSTTKGYSYNYTSSHMYN
eukprot:COSAG05_NODE_6002_length_1042_cov_1.089077_1_plen_163_part_01